MSWRHHGNGYFLQAGDSLRGAYGGGPSCSDDLEAELETAAREGLFTEEVASASDGVRFIAEHLKDEDESANVRLLHMTCWPNFKIPIPGLPFANVI